MKILINGVRGKMGQMAQSALEADSYFQVVAKTDKDDNLASAIRESGANIVVDFTSPDAVYQNTLTIIQSGIHPVIGSTGLSLEQIIELQALCTQQSLGGIIAPNFSLGAVLMMQFAQKAAHYFQQVEIIEAHHENKRDAPSGTAITTAERIAKVRRNSPLPVETTEIFKSARGAEVESVPIHSVRLPGVLAAQDVIFGSTGETFTLSHATINRDCYREGLLLACKKVTGLSSLVHGLESLLLS